MRTRSLVVGYFPAIFLTKSDAPHSVSDVVGASVWTALIAASI